MPTRGCLRQDDEMHYPATILPDGPAWRVSFRHVPEALTGARTRADALSVAADALATAAKFYLEDGRQMRAPSTMQAGDAPVLLATDVEAKLRRAGLLS
jgi:antitoxin HicB